MKLGATKKKCIALLITVAEIAASLQIGSLNFCSRSILNTAGSTRDCQYIFCNR